MKQRAIRHYFLDADAVAKKKGMMQASNMAMLGYFSTLQISPYTFESIEETIREKVKAKLVDKNFEVFQAGYKLAHSS
jgi:Pyruvate/2-oxoacid:ferredoxin oxidoreductase gamma subunit